VSSARSVTNGPLVAGASGLSNGILVPMLTQSTNCPPRGSGCTVNRAPSIVALASLPPLCLPFSKSRMSIR